MSELLSKAEVHKSLLGPAGLQPQVLREQAGGLVRPLQKGDVLRTGRQQPARGLMSGAVDGNLAERPGAVAGDQWHQVDL